MEKEDRPKRQRRTQCNFSDEFQRGCGRAGAQGRSVTQVAKDLDLTASALGKWVEQARADGGKSKRGTLTTEEKDEIAKPRKEVRELRLEREILKKRDCRHQRDDLRGLLNTQRTESPR